MSATIARRASSGFCRTCLSLFFLEKELFRQGCVIREIGALGCSQGETFPSSSVSSNYLMDYDERATSLLLLAAGFEGRVGRGSHPAPSGHDGDWCAAQAMPRCRGIRDLAGTAAGRHGSLPAMRTTMTRATMPMSRWSWINNLGKNRCCRL